MMRLPENGSQRGRWLDDLGQEIQLRARGVLGGELHVLAQFARLRNAFGGPAHDLFLLHSQLELAMNRAGGEEHVQARLLGLLQRLPGAINVLIITTC